MKKAVAMVMVLVMMLALGVSAFAESMTLTLDEAKQAALAYAGVKAADATFVKAHQDWDDGRKVYDIKFFANGVEYDLDVDVNTGRITGFDTEYMMGYTQPSANPQPANPNGYYDWDDMYDRDWDDRWDRDWDDMWDRDWDDRYDRDWDDMWDWDD